MKVLSGEGIKDFALLGIFQIVRGQQVRINEQNKKSIIHNRVFYNSIHTVFCFLFIRRTSH